MIQGLLLGVETSWLWFTGFRTHKLITNNLNMTFSCMMTIDVNTYFGPYCSILSLGSTVISRLWWGAAIQPFYTTELLMGCVSDAALHNKGFIHAPAGASLRITATEMPPALSSETLMHSCVSIIYWLCCRLDILEQYSDHYANISSCPNVTRLLILSLQMCYYITSLDYLAARRVAFSQAAEYLAHCTMNGYDLSHQRLWSHIFMYYGYVGWGLDVMKTVSLYAGSHL